MELKSDFPDGETIPVKYTETGQNNSPQLTWGDVPAGTASLAVLCEDPDAPSPRRPAEQPWVHWLICNIPISINEFLRGFREASIRQKSRVQFKVAIRGRKTILAIGAPSPLPEPANTVTFFGCLRWIDDLTLIRNPSTRRTFCQQPRVMFWKRLS